MSSCSCDSYIQQINVAEAGGKLHNGLSPACYTGIQWILNYYSDISLSLPAFTVQTLHSAYNVFYMSFVKISNM